ncbi:MAG TPA: VOC family protein [Thermoplasmata archaeon]|jgi:catechol 2,3-dioxygenase-like lactoylglutathione lyase family enzyme|nr:VOC family protein [Thermoplasmata archaeon]
MAAAPQFSPTSIELNNPRILVRDFARSWAFYTGTLGLTPVFGDGSPPYGEVGDKTHFVGLFSRSEMDKELGPPVATPRPDNRISLVFEVTNVDAAHAHLVRLGVEILSGPTDRPAWGLRTIHFRDPDGNLIELFTRLAAA